MTNPDGGASGAATAAGPPSGLSGSGSPPRGWRLQRQGSQKALTIQGPLRSASQQGTQDPRFTPGVTPRFLSMPTNLSLSHPPKAEARGEVVGGGLLGSRQRTFAVLSFAACSSTMLVFNKLAVQQIRLPSSLISFQMIAAIVTLRLSSYCGWLELERLGWGELRWFALPVFTFTGSVFCNVNGLQYSNVETFIVFRCSTPIVASVVEGLCMDRELPCLRSWIAMAMVLSGASAFVISNGTFRVYSQLWVLVWYVFTVADALVLRTFMQTVDMSLWSRAYWYNALALPFFLCAALWNEEYARLHTVPLTTGAAAALGASTVVGFFIAYTGFMLRSVTSAASFLVVATVCKVITIALSILIWRQTGSMLGLAGLLQCVVGGAIYVEAPTRSPPPTDKGQRQDRSSSPHVAHEQPQHRTATAGEAPG